ncbi:hypothetical protein GCM10008018_55010 [Paenibacillus marchantiophytorum]|uniref:DUF1572 domain-containing protein n=1 Tax=Paenibacillus marchantiophytorum TaxID=1619310 RepID=A0ABQ1F8E1_9BACL|nr:DUF1572 family protein [Paenibacillus marchantiophytorum]GGA01722.1 hypothetical protein GCM10008018_55010 [Paenibacillus marchantiophytorum]
MAEQDQVAMVFLQESIRAFASMKKLADKALTQAEDAHFYLTLDEESNSLEVLIKHMHGNMLSRWTDFLTTDGEKATRERDSEFEGQGQSRETLLSLWEEGWSVLFSALNTLEVEDVLGIVQIRGEGHTVLQAIQRQVSHYGYHVGQIVLLSKHWASGQWQTLSIARGQSKQFKP